MIKVIIGIFLFPLIGWVLTAIPLPATLPTELFTALESAITWLWALNQIIPIDTALLLFIIMLTINVAEGVINLIFKILHFIKH